MKRMPFAVVILVLSVACGGSPTNPTPVVTAPAAPTAAAARIIGLTISASRDELMVNQTSVLNATALFDDGSVMPITPEWESSSGAVTVIGNGPVALATGQQVGFSVIRARAAGLVTVRGLLVKPQQ